VDLVSLVHGVFEFLQRTMPDSIHLLLAVGPDDCMVSADPNRMQQVLTNLALNARDAIPEGGELSIGLSRFLVRPGEEPPLTEMSHGAWVYPSVADTGAGILPEVASHLFDPFFTSKPAGHGSGMGLAQVHGIVEYHQGHIGVETQIGQGTNFRIYLPALNVEKRKNLLKKESQPLQGRQNGLFSWQTMRKWCATRVEGSWRQTGTRY